MKLTTFQFIVLHYDRLNIFDEFVIPFLFSFFFLFVSFPRCNQFNPGSTLEGVKGYHRARYKIEIQPFFGAMRTNKMKNDQLVCDKMTTFHALRKYFV